MDQHATVETCGYCRGTLPVPGRKYDSEGRYRRDWPNVIPCEYCAGSGEVKNGAKLLPARQPQTD